MTEPLFKSLRVLRLLLVLGLLCPTPGCPATARKKEFDNGGHAAYSQQYLDERGWVMCMQGCWERFPDATCPEALDDRGCPSRRACACNCAQETRQPTDDWCK